MQNSLQNACRGHCNYFNKRISSSLRSERNVVFFLCLWLLIAVLCWLTFRRTTCGWLKTRQTLTELFSYAISPWKEMARPSPNNASLWMWSALSSHNIFNNPSYKLWCRNIAHLPKMNWARVKSFEPRQFLDSNSNFPATVGLLDYISATDSNIIWHWGALRVKC